MADRAPQRAEERERRAQERALLAQTRAEIRNERRTAEREQAARERQERRDAHRLEQAERLVSRPPTVADGSAPPAAPKRRASGSLRRTGEARVERDTRNYRTVIDQGRIRALSARGTSAASLASVFGLSIEDIEAALSWPALDDGDTTGTSGIRHDR